MRKFCIAVIVMALASPFALGDVAIGVSSGGGGTPGGGTNHGWEFTVNEEGLILTHLGLFDLGDDGLIHEHPIGVFDLNANLLTSGTMPAGTGAPLLDHFRYIDVEDLALSMDETYVVSYYSASSGGDFVITAADDLWVNPAVNLIQGRWGGEGFFTLPGNTTGAHRIGPNFQFIPEPGTLALLALGALVVARRRS
jgi:hypothetical protein